MTTDSTPALAGDEHGAPPIAPFWNKLNEFFLFPFQIEPLIWALGLSAAGYVLLLLPGLLMKLLLVPPLLALGIAFYFFKVAALASRGVLHSRDYTHDMMDPEWKTMPWALFGVLIVHGIIIVFLARINPLLGLLARLISSLLLPATVMVLIRSSSMLAALNPMELLATMTDIGLQYLLLCLFLFLLQMGMPMAMTLLLPVAPELLLIPLALFVTIYFVWVMAALIGYVMYQHHEALQIDLLRQPQSAGAAEPTAADIAKAQARQRDADVSALVREGRLREAMEQAREWARTSYDSAVDEDRYHRVLLHDDPASGRLAGHAQRYLPLLLGQKQGRQALQVFQAVSEKVPGFALERPAHTLALAEQAWNRQDANQTLAVLRSFDKRYPQAAEIPRAYELIIRALKQGLERSDVALPVYQALARRYPDHPSTQEAAWVLREELKAGR